MVLDDVDRFIRANEVASYAGLVLKQLESGKMSRFDHIDRRDAAPLRSLLVAAVWCVWQHNAQAKLWVSWTLILNPSLSSSNKHHRFSRSTTLRRVHECVFGVLALESEPADPWL